MSKKVEQAPNLAALVALGIKAGNTVLKIETEAHEVVINPIAAWFDSTSAYASTVINDTAIVVINELEADRGYMRFRGSFPAVFIDPEPTADNQIRVIIKSFHHEAGFLLSKRDASLMSHSRDAFRALIKSSVIDCLNELAGK